MISELGISISDLEEIYLLMKGLCVMVALFMVCCTLYKRVAIKKRSL